MSKVDDAVSRFNLAAIVRITDDPEIQLIGILETGLARLTPRARARVLRWADSWATQHADDPEAT